MHVNKQNRLTTVSLKGSKIAGRNQVHFQNQEDLKIWFKDTFEIGVLDENGESVINFSCVSNKALELFLASKISAAQASITGIARMWKIYQSHTSEFFKTVYRIFTTLSPRFSLGTLAVPLDILPTRDVKIFDLRATSNSAWFGVGSSKARLRFSFFVIDAPN